MGVSGELLGLLVCPETKQPLEQLSEEAVCRLNEKIALGKVKNRAGDLVVEPVSGLLLRQDGQFAYPVRADIPVMLIDQAVPAEAVSR